MSEELPSNVDLDQVNEATLELLERRISANVRGEFLKTISLPIGGGGLLAIVFSVMVWVPTQVESLINGMVKGLDIEGKVETLANEMVQPLVAEELAAEVNRQLSSEVADYLDSPMGKKSLAEGASDAVNIALPEIVSGSLGSVVDNALPGVVSGSLGSVVDNALPGVVAGSLGNEVAEAFKKNEVQQLIAGQVSRYVQNEGKDLIRDTVQKTLLPTLETSMNSIESKSGELVGEIADESVTTVNRGPKGGWVDLEKFLRDLREAPPDQKKKPVVLTLTVGIGPYYGANAIREWHQAVSEEAEERFRHVVLLYGNQRTGGEFIASINKDGFRRKLDDSEDELMTLLGRKSEEFSRKQAESALQAMFGTECTRRICEVDKIGEVLRSSRIWPPDPKPDTGVPVVDDRGILVGFTTRGMLEKSILDTI